jgi:hypothetical protein
VVLSGLTRDHISLALVTSLYVPFMISVNRRSYAVLAEQIASSPPVDIEGLRAMMREVGIEEVVDATLTI